MLDFHKIPKKMIRFRNPDLTFEWNDKRLTLLDLKGVEAKKHGEGFIVRINHPDIQSGEHYKIFKALQEAEKEKQRIVRLWEDALEFELRTRRYIVDKTDR